MNESSAGSTDKVDRLFIPAKKRDDIYSLEKNYRVCAYCRVSTDSEMQQTSFELQKQHYEQVAESHPNWELKKIFADEGITGTSLKHRDQFNAMIEACQRGEYDVIITKAVSRFARNIVDCLKIARSLKNQTPPVGIFFETDTLFTLAEDSELKLALLSAFAQGESEKKSDSINWSLEVRFRNGQLLMPELLGYSRKRDAIGRYIKDAPLEIVESEAKIVRFIFDAFTAEYSVESIADILNELEIPTKTGKTKWTVGSIRYILGNERYCGDVKTWKTFTADVFEHTKRKNLNNEREQYVYKGRHEAIITSDKFEAAQTLLSNLSHGIRGYSATHVIDSGIFTGYVPVNPKWINDNPNVYFEASNSIEQLPKDISFKKDFFCRFDLGGFQVVRGHFMTLRDGHPNITVSSNRISFNSECIRRFNDVSHVQLLIHPSERKIAIRPCSEHDVHSIKWHIDSEKQIMWKGISTPYFSTALYQIMNWNPDFQYRICGTLISRGYDRIIIFDISKAVSITYIEQEDEKRKRVYLCPEEWNNSFGSEFYDFCIQNRLFYANENIRLNSQAKCKAVNKRYQTLIPSDVDILKDIEQIKTRQVMNG